MFTQSEYNAAWLAYLAGVILVMACAWFISRKWRWVEARYLFRLLLAVFLLVPWYTSETQDYLSPAWVISLLEAFFEGPEHIWRAGFPLLVALIVALFISIAASLVKYFVKRHKSRELADPSN